MSATYALITPVRNEAENLARLAEHIAAQSAGPLRWVIVENGSTDKTLEVAQQLALEYDWVRVSVAPGLPREAGLVRGAPIVRAFHCGLASLDIDPEVIVKLDADITMGCDYFRRILDKFAADASLGMASGIGYEREGDGAWRQQRHAPGSVWGAVRAYRRDCLEQILPLEERMGWDGIDQYKANMRGWRTKTFEDVPFRHHRSEGERDGSRFRAWAADGDIAYFMHYRRWFLLLRTFHQARRDPSAVAMLWGYATAALRREQRCSDKGVLEYIRAQQSLRTLPARAREALQQRRQLRSS